MPLISDTSPDVEQILMGLLRAAPPWRKLEMVAQLNQAVREMALIGLRNRYPAASPAELQRRLAGLLLGEELATQVYGKLNSSDKL